MTGATLDEREDGAGGTTEQSVLISNIGILVAQSFARAYPLLDAGAQRFQNDPVAMGLYTTLFGLVIQLEGMR